MIKTFQALFILLVIIGYKPAFAQCANSVKPSCGVYTTCFSKYCNCASSPSEYFISYGKQYCERFLGNTKLSKAGEKWRDATLVCLQEKIVPHLAIAEPAKTCDCPKMRKIAIDSHVACYTQAPTSMCNLEMNDIIEIGKIVDKKDIFSSEGWDSMKQITAVCKTQATTPERRAKWSTMNSLLNAY